MKGNRQPYGPIDETVLAQFERRLPASLPADLRQFLVESNGATFSGSAELSDVPGGAALEAVFGLHGGPEDLRLDHMRAQFEGLVPGSIIVFAADCYGNYFGVSLHDLDAGTVYFVDHENLPATRESLVRVAGSFTELLARSRAQLESLPSAATIAEAIDSGDCDQLRQLVHGGAGLAGMVHRAVIHGDLKILATLLEEGGDANERGAIGGTETPLFVAARRGRADLTELLIRFGADPNLRCGAGGTALQMAAPWPHVVEVLRRSGAKS